MVTTSPTEHAASTSPLSEEQLLAIARASSRAGKIRRAARVAGFNAWTTAFFAGLSLLLMFWGISALAVFVTVGLAVVAFHEFRGQRMLRRFEVGACQLLGWNQIGFMSVIVIYCAWSMVAIANGPDVIGEYAGAGAAVAGLGDMEQDIRELVKVMVYAIYGGAIIGTVMFQGGNAWYYFSRAGVLRGYLAETEPWVVDVLRATIGR